MAEPASSAKTFQIPEKNALCDMSSEVGDESRQSLFQGKLSLYHVRPHLRSLSAMAGLKVISGGNTKWHGGLRREFSVETTERLCLSPGKRALTDPRESQKAAFACHIERFRQLRNIIL